MGEKAIPEGRRLRRIMILVGGAVVLLGAYAGIMHLVREHVTQLIRANEQEQLPGAPAACGSGT